MLRFLGCGCGRGGYRQTNGEESAAQDGNVRHLAVDSTSVETVGTMCHISPLGRKELIGHEDKDIMEIQNMGVAGMVVCSPQMSELIQCLIVAAQGMTIQVMSCFYLSRHLIRPPEIGVLVDRYVLTGAVFVHYLNCINEWPFFIQVLMSLHYIHKDWYAKLLAYPLFILDALVIPAAVLVLGSLYLCTAENTQEVILNSVGIAFLKDIDNYVASLHMQVQLTQGLCKKGSILIPHRSSFLGTAALWMLVYVPLVPIICSWILVNNRLDSVV